MNKAFLHKKIKVSAKGGSTSGRGKKNIDAFLIRLQYKNLIVLVGKNGYVMCGYLNLKVANKFKDVAIKVVGVSSIEETLNAKVHSCSNAAKRLGIKKDQGIKEALKIIA